ncbi:uncharacterized protein LOC135701422 [Ochlerotatus camptorhynchus]|uniref:uncharacterized protein LOC135701422 n=1 Tax=Ochlerotatus camptorhynchus TaxID=644619 RepID=UPI0031E093DC
MERFYCFLPALMVLVPTVRGYCTTTIPVNLLEGCAFRPLMAMSEQSGWVLSKENCGESIAVEVFEVPPVLFFDFTDPEKLYTLIMVDMDGASTEDRLYLHWIVANVPASTFTQGMTYMDGDTVMDFLAPTSGHYEHRYEFYLYEQVYGTSYPPMPNSREEFDLAGWINSIYPEGALCGPVASIGFNS